jgi:hypothetical protein
VKVSSLKNMCYELSLKGQSMVILFCRLCMFLEGRSEGLTSGGCRGSFSVKLGRYRQVSTVKWRKIVDDVSVDRSNSSLGLISLCAHEN